MKIGLMGFEAKSANKGCEALTYSFLKILEEFVTKEDEIIIISTDKSIEEITEYFSNLNIRHIYEELKDLRFTVFRTMMECDYIFDITMGDSFSDIYAGKACKNTILEKRIAEILCKKYVLLPQTYGPFNIKKNEKMAMNVINKAWKVFTRDELSMKYILNHIPNKNISLVTDLAFLLPYEKSRYEFFDNPQKIKIGINVSGLLWKGGFDRRNQFDLALDYQKYIKLLLEKYSNDANYSVYLIPHVIDLKSNAHDDDYRVSEMISKEYNIKIAPVFSNPIEAKSFIANMDVFVGARMHSTIGAFSSGVATIPFSYSRKFEGLYNQLGYRYLISGKTMNIDEAYEKTVSYISNLGMLKLEIQKIMKDTNKFISIFKNEMEKVFSD